MNKINLGDVYWLPMAEGISHPHVVISVEDKTVTICALTTNMKKLTMPGNVVLEVGEANLEKLSIVEVAKVLTVDKSELGDYVGSIGSHRVAEIMAGISFLRKSFFANRG